MEVLGSNMRVTITFVDDSTDDNKFQIPTLITKEGVQTLNDLAFVYAHATRAAGFLIGDVVVVDEDGMDIASSADIMNINFGGWE